MTNSSALHGVEKRKVKKLFLKFSRQLKSKSNLCHLTNKSKDNLFDKNQEVMYLNNFTTFIIIIQIKRPNVIIEVDFYTCLTRFERRKYSK